MHTFGPPARTHVPASLFPSRVCNRVKRVLVALVKVLLTSMEICHSAAEWWQIFRTQFWGEMESDMCLPRKLFNWLLQHKYYSLRIFLVEVIKEWQVKYTYPSAHVLLLEKSEAKTKDVSLFSSTAEWKHSGGNTIYLNMYVYCCSQIGIDPFLLLWYCIICDLLFTLSSFTVSFASYK